MCSELCLLCSEVSREYYDSNSVVFSLQYLVGMFQYGLIMDEYKCFENQHAHFCFWQKPPFHLVCVPRGFP